MELPNPEEVFASREAKAEEAPKEVMPNEVASQSTGNVSPAAMELRTQWQEAKMICLSGLAPRALNTPEKVMVAIRLCREHNLPPITCLGKVAIINGTPSFWGELPLALVQRSGLLETIEEAGSEAKASCSVKRKGFPVISREFSIEDAKKAGLLSKDPWKFYPRRMMQMRARAWALKDAFPDVLLGVAIAEYDFGVQPEENGPAIEVERPNAASKINERFGSKAVAESQVSQ